MQEPETAKKLISKIRNEISNLKYNPKIYSIVDDDLIKNDNVEIVRVMYGRRNWIDLL